MNTEKIIDFFNAHASSWDEHQQRNEAVIELILDKGGVKEGSRVLDVACGTGVLIGDYLERKATVTGIDISPEMIKLAKEKYPDAEFICADVQTFCFGDKFDVIMIYNAFPHFSDRSKLFENLAAQLSEKGRLTVAHGMSEEALRIHHSGAANEISTELPCKEAMAELMSAFLEVDVMISDENMYMVSGIKR